MGVRFRGVKLFLLVSWVVIAASGLIARRHLVPEPKIGLSQLLSAFPGAHHFSDRLKNPPRRDAYAQDGSLLGCVVRSSDLAPQVKGYGGRIPLLIGVSPGGTIAGVVALDHSETPSYVRDISRFLDRFRGRNVKEKLSIGVDLDGMTGATVTSKAIADGVRISARAAAERLYGLELPPEEREGFPLGETVKSSAAILLFGIAIFSVLRKKGRLRWLTLGIGLAVVGFVYNFQLSVLNLASIASLRPSLSLSFWILFGLSVLTAPLLGRVYCNWICPFGALQEIAHRALPGRGEHASAHRQFELLKYVILWETTLAAVLTANLAYADYEPFMTLFSRRGAPLLWLFLGSVLFFSLFRYRFWCRYFCALGAFYQMLSRFRLGTRFEFGGIDDKGRDTGGT
jgi:NosR/NirI family nitrous oxide reductase transcriptional regulator